MRAKGTALAVVATVGDNHGTLGQYLWIPGQAGFILPAYASPEAPGKSTTEDHLWCPSSNVIHGDCSTC